MVCKGICVRHKAMKPIGTGRYSTGQKRCQVCEIFLNWNGLWCPCCGYRLRTRPRNSKFKAELRANNEIDKAKSLGVYEQPPIQAHQKHIAHKSAFGYGFVTLTFTISPHLASYAAIPLMMVL